MAEDKVRRFITIAFAETEGIKLQRRDKREPDREWKEIAQKRIQSIVRRRFKRQKAAILDWVQRQAVYTKAPIPPDDLFEDEEWDIEDEAAMMHIILWEMSKGAERFSSSIGMTFDTSGINVRAAKFARTYLTKWLADLDKTSREIVRNALALFVETPGMTIGDLVKMLPFNEERALRIAVTETTRIYAKGQMIAAKELKKQYPDVRIIKTWFTDNDDKVCEICGPLHGMTIDVDEPFYDIEDDLYQDGNPPAHVNCRCWIETSTDIRGTR